jgi:hypothetical protein
MLQYVHQNQIQSSLLQYDDKNYKLLKWKLDAKDLTC